MNLGLGEIDAVFVLWTLAKGVCILGLAAALTAMLTKRSAALRAALWNMTFLALLAVPFLQAVGPQWHASPVEKFVRFPWVEQGASPEASTTIVRESNTAALARTEGSEPRSVGPTLSISMKALARLGVAIWGVGALTLIFRLVAAHWRVRAKYTRSARPVSGPIRERLEVLKKESGIRRRIRAVFVEEDAGPMTLFSRRPTIYLPENVDDLSETAMDVILRHELAHIVRRDPLWAFIGQAAATLYWPIPFMRSALRAQRRAQEVASDNLALSGGIAPCDYADTLLHLRAVFASEDSYEHCALSMNCGNGLSERVEAALSDRIDRRPVSRSQQIVVAAMALGVALILGSVRTGTSQETDGGQSAGDDWGGWIRLSRNPLWYDADPDLKLERSSKGDGSSNVVRVSTGEIVESGLLLQPPHPRKSVNPWGFIAAEDSEPFMPNDMDAATELWRRRVSPYFGDAIDSDRGQLMFNPRLGVIVNYGSPSIRYGTILRLADPKFKPSTFRVALEVREFGRSEVARIQRLVRAIQPSEFNNWNGSKPIGFRVDLERQSDWDSLMFDLFNPTSGLEITASTVTVTANSYASIGSPITISGYSDLDKCSLSVYPRYDYETGHVAFRIGFSTISMHAGAWGLVPENSLDSWVLLFPVSESSERSGWVLRVEQLETIEAEKARTFADPANEENYEIHMRMITQADADNELRKELGDAIFESLPRHLHSLMIENKIRDLQLGIHRERQPR